MLKQYTCIAKAIEKLFYPHLEVIIHDIKKQKITYIGNNFSNRDIGDDSILDDITFDNSKNIIGPYEKINYDGKKLKSISAILKNEDGQAAYLLCMNFDLSILSGLTNAIDVFIGKSNYDKSASALFKEDWQEKINIFIYESLKKQGKTVETVDKEDKKKLIINLNNKGAFKGKNTKEYAAKILKISRASLYNYLNEKELE
jgi:D-arginine utilization repressor